MIKDHVSAIEARKGVLDAFNWAVQKRLSRSVVARYPEVHNDGRSPFGRNVIGWGEGMTVYSVLTRTTPRISSTARRLHTAD